MTQPLSIHPEIDHPQLAAKVSNSVIRRSAVVELPKLSDQPTRNSEIESNRTAARRRCQLPEWLRNRRPASANSPVPKSEGPGAPSTEENAPWDRDNPPIKPSGPKARSIPAWGAAPGRRTPQFQRAEGPTYRAGGANRIVICANLRFPNRQAPRSPKARDRRHPRPRKTPFETGATGRHAIGPT
jgi:hypothetical protein